MWGGGVKRVLCAGHKGYSRTDLKSQGLQEKRLIKFFFLTALKQGEETRIRHVFDRGQRKRFLADVVVRSVTYADRRLKRRGRA